MKLSGSQAALEIGVVVIREHCEKVLFFNTFLILILVRGNKI